jgi:outer membrane lipoprotein-sorting protein
MKTFLRGMAAVVVFAAIGSAQNDSAELNRVLAQMDANSQSFRSAEANFVWDQYQKVINETDSQKGKIYYRRQNQDMQIAIDITEPERKTVLYTGGKVRMYQPKIDQVTEYDAGKNKSDVEGFLALGFGGSGRDLQKSYDMKYLGKETVGGVEATKLELVPKSAKVRNNISRFLLWIDPVRGVSIQQQLFEPSGDYRLSKYSDIQVNQKVPDDVFKLKTSGKTQVISPQK